MTLIKHLLILVISIGYFHNVSSQSVVNTVHNLSVSGPGAVKATSEDEICVFCHSPHNSSPRAPLWNRNDPGATYTLYSSSTLEASPGQPDGASLLCLSCHDGTIALGDVLSRTSPISFGSGITTMPSGDKNLTTDLSDDHPVSFVYNSSLASADGELADPTGLSGPVKLENGKVQCTSCHDPHNNDLGDFLVASTRNSDLCLYCHQKNLWNGSRHESSTANWNGSGNDPWFHTPFTTVNDNACENCHNPHGAGSKSSLLNYFEEENNCLNCHNGNVANTNIESQLNKTYRHDVFAYSQLHDANEQALLQTRHVECEDCHNPHRTTNASAQAPDASGFITGIRGVDTDGNPVSDIHFQYELCYRCHADSPDKPASAIPRIVDQNNVRLEFDLTNPSFHPIEGPGQNPDVPSLIAPLSESSVIYCTDCHASDGNSPAGPHGSIFPHILKYQYSTSDPTIESSQSYELCYQCHDRAEIINGSSNFADKVHKKHVVEEDIPCSNCHDPHGISSSQGDATNHSHLINFNTAVVSPEPKSGRLEFVDQGSFKGQCYLLCHGEKHDPESY